MKAWRLLLLFILLLEGTGIFAQHRLLWKAVSEEGNHSRRNASYEVSKRKTYELDIDELRNRLKNTPLRGQQNGHGTAMDFPMPDGRTATFRVYETPVLHSSLRQQHKQIRSYTGRSPEDPSLLIKFTLTTFGFHGMIFTPEREVIYINPEDKEAGIYEVFSKGEVSPKAFDCQVQEMTKEVEKNTEENKIAVVNDGNLRTFRLALAATAEYTLYHANAAGVGSGTDEEKRAAALAAMVVTMTRVNGIFESEMGITMELVPNESIIFLNANTDGLTNNDGVSLISEIQEVIDTNIGFANYDIGHVFSTGGGGIAHLSSPCTAVKARGVTGLDHPVGDPFDVDFVAHEMGHQYGATHTFNNSCGGNRTNFTAVEPGSGSTIMTYAGLCPPDIQTNVSAYFHAISIQQMWDNITGGSSTCAALTPTGNTAPVADAGNDYTIPVSTPFVLEGQGTDADGDALTYSWEQMDTEISIQPPAPTSTGGPLFRSVEPALSPARYFPNIPNLLAGNLSTVWEVLPGVSRELNFSFLVRDNNPDGGQTARDNARITVADNSGPFAVTSQVVEEAWEAGEVHTITWDVANTDIVPVSATYVTILLYTDPQLDNSIVLADNVVNDGSHDIIVPGGVETTTGRIMVRPVNNIFFSINAADITITQSEYVLYFASLEHTACQPDDGIFSFTYNTYLGFSGVTDFTAVGVPAGLTVSFSPASAMVDGTEVEVTVANTGGVPAGNYTFTIHAASGALVRDYGITLSVYDNSLGDVSLSAPADGASEVELQPQLQWQAVNFAVQYEIQISDVPDFSSVVESAVIRYENYTPLTLQDLTTYYWRVRPLNGCVEGAFGNVFSFTTIAIDCRTFSYNTPVPITDAGTTNITASVFVVEDLPVQNISLHLDITHSWVEDLRASLTSPSGTVVQLFSHVCGNGDDVNATFNDDGFSVACAFSSPAISGVIRPDQPLSAFAGESAQGEWVLTVYDDADKDGGTLNAFSLDMCVNGLFPPDADADGVTDALDLCPGTPAGEVVDVNGCTVFSLPFDNFTIATAEESCMANNDGGIFISANQVLNYQVTLSGNGVNLLQNFTDGIDFTGLSAGTYTVCIMVNGQPGYEQCYEVVVSEPQPLSVQFKVNDAEKSVSLEMTGGGLYTITLNGNSTQTTAGEITLELKNGINTLTITTEKACQGIYEEDILIGNAVVVSPNPAREEITVSLMRYSGGKVNLSLYSLTGKRVYHKEFQEVTAAIPVRVSDLPAGIYLLRVSGKDLNTTQKIVKL